MYFIWPEMFWSSFSLFEALTKHTPVQYILLQHIYDDCFPPVPEPVEESPAPYSSFFPQSSARLSHSRKPVNKYSTSWFHRACSCEVNGWCVIRVAADGGAWTSAGVSARRTLKAFRLAIDVRFMLHWSLKAFRHTLCGAAPSWGHR